jgi:uncharacterized membrane protein
MKSNLQTQHIFERNKLMFGSPEPIIGLIAFIIIIMASQKVMEEGLKMPRKPSWILAGCMATLASVTMLLPDKNSSAEKTTGDVVFMSCLLYGNAFLLTIMLAMYHRTIDEREYQQRTTKHHSDNDDCVQR